MLLPNRKVFFIFLIFLLTLVTYRFFPSITYAANFAFGEDASGFFIKDRTTGNIKLRIDNNGYLSAPMKSSMAGSGSNLIFNGGFQAITDTVANVPDGWQTGYVPTACTVSTQCSYAVNTSNYYGGSQSMALTNTTGNTGKVSLASAPFTVIPGQTYTGYVHLFTNNSAVSNLNVEIIFFPGSIADTSTTYGNRISIADQPIYTSASYNSGTGWDTTNANATFTVSTTACGTSVPCAKARMIIYFNSSTATQTLYVQNATVTSGQSVNSAVNASYISSGAFGSSTGGGNYSFPGNVGIGTTGPATKLDVAGVITATSGNSTNWNSAYSHKTTEDAINGIVKVNGAGTYSAVTDNSANWNTAYGWGNHASAGYDTTNDSWTGTGNVYTTSGNVGIGTTGPGSPLTVTSATNETLASSVAVRMGVSTTPRIQLDNTASMWELDNSSGTLRFYQPGTVYANLTTSDFQAKKFTDLDNTAYYVDPNGATSMVVSGNVGIGTIAPGAKLEVSGDIYLSSGGNRNIKIPGSGPTSGSANSLYLAAQAGGTSSVGSTLGGNLYLDPGAAGTYGGSSVTAGNILMTTQNSGNVGIGTTGPGGKLDVFGGTTNLNNNSSQTVSLRVNANPAGGTLSLPNPNSFGVVSFVGDDANSTGKIGFYSYNSSSGTGNKINFYADSDNTSGNNFSLYSPQTNAVLYNAGNVGIGTAIPGGKLDVYSTSGTAINSKATGAFSTGVYGESTGSWYGLYCQGTYCGGSAAWTNNSDIRLKKDIQPITDALDKIGKLKGVTFKWKEGDQNTKLGFIAQEVQPIVPEVISVGMNGYYTMEQGPLTALLVEGIKQQQKQIETLQEKDKKIEELAEKVEKLEREIEKLINH